LLDPSNFTIKVLDFSAFFFALVPEFLF
ncbi:unnamed protein product, partial [Rhizophagus irregularis]